MRETQSSLLQHHRVHCQIELNSMSFATWSRMSDLVKDFQRNICGLPGSHATRHTDYDRWTSFTYLLLINFVGFSTESLVNAYRCGRLFLSSDRFGKSSSLRRFGGIARSWSWETATADRHWFLLNRWKGFLSVVTSDSGCVEADGLSSDHFWFPERNRIFFTIGLQS